MDPIPSLTGSHLRTPIAAATMAHWLVVIDHHEARIYRSTEPGSVPQQIRPHAAENFFHHAPDAKEASSRQQMPDPSSFFEPVAGLLNGAGAVLVFGSDSGTADEMEQFVTWIKQHRPNVAQRIVGSVVINAQKLTEAQILAQARNFFATASVTSPRSPGSQKPDDAPGNPGDPADRNDPPR